MALIVRIALLLGTLSLCKSQGDVYKTSGSQRKDAKYGRPVLAMANSPRCMFNGRPVENGRTVSSPEPCLNCTCSKGILLCYLRTCTTVVSVPGCEVVRKKGECCPKLQCRDTSEYRTERTSEPNYKYRLRQDEGSFFGLLGLDPRTEKSNYVKHTTRKPAPKIDYNQEDWLSSKIDNPSDEFQALVEQEEDYGSDQLSPDRNDSAGYCYHKGYKYKEGMAMLSPTKCEYCYCIRGKQMCVRPKCHLNIDGCVPRYQSGYTCCPSHYQCEIGVQGIGTDGYQLGPTSTTDQLANKVSSCNVEGYDFDVGVAVPSSGLCQTCYCTQMGVVCRRLECSPNVLGCTPIVPEGHCCPTEYKCDQHGGNETTAPLSHSTENYDVTVISPSEPEALFTHTTETETTSDTDYDYAENYTANSYEEESTTDTASDKQKITVELTEESSLESISVIPEENIAVLVVTTEKTGDIDIPFENAQTTRFLSDVTRLASDTNSPSYLKEKTKSTTARGATSVNSRTQLFRDTTQPIIISLPNLKQKTKPAAAKSTTVGMHGTWFTQDTAGPPLISLSNLKIKTSTTKDALTTSEEAQRIQETTKPTGISLSYLKQKVKTSPASISTATSKLDSISDSTALFGSTHNSQTSTETTKYSTHEETEYNDNNKDNYNYDYAELYDDVTHDGHETFAPFADYSEPAYGERITSTKKSTTNEMQQDITTNKRFNMKNKKPPALSQTRELTSSTTSSLTNSKFATDGLTTRLKDGFTMKISETETYPDHLISTDPSTEANIFAKYPTKYTIYSTPSERTQITSATESRGNQKQKVKPYRPNQPVINKHTPTTIKDTAEPDSTLLQISTTRIIPNGDHLTTLNRTLETHDLTETNSPSLHLAKQPTVITSNHKQKPQRFSPTTIPYKSTKPLPQDLADLLWTINQNHNFQTQATSTEVYEPATKQESFNSKISENSDFLPESLSSLVVAAPKLIVEDTTPHENYGTVEFETTNSDSVTSDLVKSSSGHPLPNVMFNAPEVIFSNHGPSSHRKQPQPVRDHVSSLQAIRGPGLPGEERLKNPSLQTVKRPSLQTVKNSGLQTIKNAGPYGIQTGRDPGFPNPQAVKDGGLSSMQIVRNPGIHTFKEPGLPGMSQQPDPPLEINNHKKTLRPRPPVRFRPPSTPSMPHSSIMEISNHRPINNFRRPSTKFPPYPIYNHRSESIYRSQQIPRDPHHSSQHFASDLHPEWREDYDEYYYDFEQSRNSPTKIFTNMQERHSTTGADTAKNTDSDNQHPESNFQKTTRQHNFNLNPTTMKVDEHQNEQNSTTGDFFRETTKITEGTDDVSTDTDVTNIREETTPSVFHTTPYPSTRQTINTPVKSFSSDPTTDDDGKLFRAEDNIKTSEASFINQHLGHYEGTPNKFEVIDGRPSAEKPTLKPLSAVSETPVLKPIDPSASDQDSKEISDVCFVDGRYYNSGEIIVKSNPCEMCRCFYGHPLCQVQQCPVPPEPSCVLEYLPGYCCPRVTCGVTADASQPPHISLPETTSQEIKPPLITSDNQWKPLPHGPVVRPAESIPKVQTPSYGTVPEVVTAPPLLSLPEEKTMQNESKLTELHAESSLSFDISKEKEESSFMTSTTFPTTTSVAPSTTTTTTKRTTSMQRVEITTYFPEITTEPPTTEPSPVFEPEPEDNDSKQNVSDIHDNSSGVRKVLDETIILPPSKMSVSNFSSENISTVLPVIQTLSPTAFITEPPQLEFETVANIVLGDLPAELGGNLKVSGCNVYGKYYKINDKVTVLSKQCRECVCSPDGIACNATC